MPRTVRAYQFLMSIRIAPFEADLTKSKRLPWVDYNTGRALRLDWNGSGMEGTIPVTRLSEYVDQYQRHPEAKAADWKGDPAKTDTIGLLGRLRLRSTRLTRIGKEVDRLDQEDGASLELDQPIEYERDDLANDIAFLATFPTGGNSERPPTDGTGMAQFDQGRFDTASSDGGSDPTGCWGVSASRLNRLHSLPTGHQSALRTRPMASIGARYRATRDLSLAPR